jgi:hypothetical protein
MLVDIPAQPVGKDATAPMEGEPTPAPVRRPGRRADLITVGVYLLGALGLTVHLWRHVNGRVLAAYPPDQLQFEYWLTHAVRVVTHGENPFFTHQLNAPDGVNMVANTSTFALTLPLLPVTLLFGPAVAFALMVILAPVTTSAAWYWLFSRKLTDHWPTALLGGAFCGFAPGMVSQDSAHPNIAAQFAVPLIIWQLARLAYTRHRIRDGIVLGLLVTYQMFLNQEIVLFLAIACLVFFGYWAWQRWPEVRPLVPGFLVSLSVGVVLSLALLAYPLWYQFAGPQHYSGLGPGAYGFGTDLLSFTKYSSTSLAGTPDSVRYATSATEENAFFGPALLAVAVLAAVLFWRRLVVRATVITALVLTILSIGPYVRFGGQYVCHCGPLMPLRSIPIASSVIATRMALALIPAIAVLLVVLLDRLRTYPDAPRQLRLVAIGAVLASLLPLVPLPLQAVTRPPVPTFFSSDDWQAYVPAGSSVVAVPLAGHDNMQPMQWDTAAHLAFPIVGGYFLGPDPNTPDGIGMYDAPPRPTSTLWGTLARTGKRPAVRPADRSAAVADLRYWHASVVVLTPRQPYEDALREVTSDLLLGLQPRLVDGLWIWDVRPLVS